MKKHNGASSIFLVALLLGLTYLTWKVILKEGDTVYSSLTGWQKVIGARDLTEAILALRERNFESKLRTATTAGPFEEQIPKSIEDSILSGNLANVDPKLAEWKQKAKDLTKVRLALEQLTTDAEQKLKRMGGAQLQPHSIELALNAQDARHLFQDLSAIESQVIKFLKEHKWLSEDAERYGKNLDPESSTSTTIIIIIGLIAGLSLIWMRN